MPGLFPSCWQPPLHWRVRRQIERERQQYERTQQEFCRQYEKEVAEVANKRAVQSYSNANCTTQHNTNQHTNFDLIPEEEKCDGTYEMPEFLKDPSYGIQYDDSNIQPGYVSERTTLFMDVLSKISDTLKKQLAIIDNASESQGVEKGAVITFFQSLSNVDEIIMKEFNSMFSYLDMESDNRIGQLKSLIESRIVKKKKHLEAIHKSNNSETIFGDKNQFVQLYKALIHSYTDIYDLFRDILNNKCPDDIAGVVEQNRDIKKYKYLDTKETKILIIQIPEALFLKSGYKSVESLIGVIEKMGVAVAAVPESLNLLAISEKDLANIDIVRLGKYIHPEEYS